MGPFINLTSGGCNWLSQGGDTCVLATVAIRGVFRVFLEVFLGGARYFEVVLAPSRHLKWCIDKRWWQPICELIGELMKEEMPARWARPLPGGESAPPPSHLCQAESGRHPPPGVLLAHSCLCWCLACDPGVSVARKCVQHALVPPHLLCRIPNTFLQQLKISPCNSKVETETDRKSRRSSVN